MSFKPLQTEITTLKAKVSALEADLRRAEKNAADANWAKVEAQATLRQEQAAHTATKELLKEEREERREMETRHAMMMADGKKNGASKMEKKTGWRVRVTSHDTRGRLEEFVMTPITTEGKP